ncbi:hypothetical protein HXX01_02450 [Candidatus Nomurabacteria bacterium]|nr:hypothetical protein [Candidatus Nomurabacteria bacterium]
MKFLINDQEVSFSKEDFPMLVNGQAFIQSGASFFSVSLMTKLFEEGEKIVFFTGFPPAKELFRNQLGSRVNDKNIIIIESGDEENFIKELDNIGDLDERIVLFKNIEEYSQNLFDKLKNHKLTIFSGDVDKCAFSNSLMKMDFKAQILFTYPENLEIENKIDLPKFSGHIIGERLNGIIRIEQ